ncbi:probable basic-leucine zipper transcription factor O [Scaptodrosophila lebanonensis]|uniref:Probable basic-leucine zipper transcription factor O n=1 Tax=Drosophila lebanonensis TaxID=7225 RepID=A0A6J2THT9_DROLE|nr:probable basic-leucine zipper transcription factor O [Scaptodrosophila lebanonensis]
MMKATAWFCPVLLTLLCATRLVCTAQRGGDDGDGYPLNYLDAQAIQDDYLLAKRNKPSLSIVNPLDVLRQRLLLEIARRQMKENTRQVELNRAILKNVGKRVFLGSTPSVATRHFQQQQQEAALLEEQRLQRLQQLQQQHFPSQLWSLVQSPSQLASSTGLSSRFFDFVQQQRPQSESQHRHEMASNQQQLQLLDDAKKSQSVAGLGKHQANGNEIANETNHENGNRKVLVAGKGATGASEGINDVASYDIPDDNDSNWTSDEQNNANNELFDSDNVDNANERLPWRFLYRLHKSQHYGN